MEQAHMPAETTPIWTNSDTNMCVSLCKRFVQKHGYVVLLSVINSADPDLSAPAKADWPSTTAVEFADKFADKYGMKRLLAILDDEDDATDA